jgi:hypothetical protein
MFLLLFLPLLTLFAGLRSAQVDRDYENYLSWFQTIASGPLSVSDWIKDPAFVLISFPFARLGMHYAVALTVMVGLALSAKLLFAEFAGVGRWLTLFVYLAVCRFFLVQEMTAIRVAAAIPLMSFSILMAHRRRYIPASITYVIACTFHLSALLALPVIILIRAGVRFRSVWWIISLLPLGIVLELSLERIFVFLSALDRISPYFGETEGISLISIYFLARLFILLLLLVHWRKLNEEQHLITFCAAFGLFVQGVFYSNEVLALRAAEVFGLFDVLMFMIPLGYLRRVISFGYAAVLIVLGAIFFMSGMKIVQPYNWIF